MSRFLFTAIMLCTLSSIQAQQTTLAQLLVAELPELPLTTQRKIIAQLPPQQQKKHTYPLFVHTAKLRTMLRDYFCHKSVRYEFSDEPILCCAISPDGNYLACCKQGSGQIYIPCTETRHDLDTNNHIVIYETTPFVKKIVLSFPTNIHTNALSWSLDSTTVSAYCGTMKISFPMSDEKSIYNSQIQRLFLSQGKKGYLSRICGHYNCDVCTLRAVIDEQCTLEQNDNTANCITTACPSTNISAQFKPHIAKIALVPQQSILHTPEIILIKLPYRNLLQLTLAQLSVLENFSAFKTSQTAIDTLPLHWQVKINKYLNQARLGALQTVDHNRSHLKHQNTLEAKETCHDIPYINKNNQAII